MKFFRTTVFLIAALLSFAVNAGPRHGIKVVDTSSFNNGKFQAHLNFTSIGGDYPFINELKNIPNWGYADNSGTPSPDALDANGYPIPGSAIFSHSGVSALLRIPDVSYTGNARVYRVTGKGTPSVSGLPTTVFSVSGATVNVSGSATTLTLSGTPTYALRHGMEIPLSVVTGVTALNGGGGNLTAGGTTGAWTICQTYNGSSLTIPLCLNDQVTPLQTSGTASGSATVTYGRFAVGVATDGRVLFTFPSAPLSITVGITATNASTPISDLALMRPAWEALWDACTVPGKACFSPDLLSLLATSKPAWLRDLNTTTSPSGSVLQGQVNWATRKPTTYFSYGASYAPSTSYAGATTSASAGVSTGNDYQLTFGSGAPTAGTQILFKLNADAVTISTGSPAQITWTNHNMVVGQPFNLFYTVAPGLSPSGQVPNGPTNLFVLSVVDANTITFSTSVGGAAVGTTSGGTGVVAHQTVVKSTTVTVSGAPTTNVAWSGHLLTANEPVACSGGPAPIYTPQKLYIKTVTDANNVTFSTTPGGTAITFTANQSNFACIREPTLNLNGTGAVPIRGIEGTGISVSTRTNTPQYGLGNNSSGIAVVHGALVYDSVLGVWEKMGADAGLGNQYISNFWPPEIFLEFCKQVGAHPWFVTPFYTTDPATDWLPELMTYVKNNKASWQTPAYETSNEDWNNVFYDTAYGINHATMYTKIAGWSQGGNNQYVGKIGSIIGQTATNIYGTHLDSSVYQAIVGVQTGSFTGTGGPANNATRNTSADYVGQSASPQSLVWSGGTINFAKDPAYKWITHNADAQYWAPGYYYNPTLLASLGASFKAGRIRNGTIDSLGTGAGVAGNILNVTQFGQGSGNLDIGTQLFAPGINSNGLTSTLTITAVSPTVACGGIACTGTGGLGTYAVSGNVSVGSNNTFATINFLPSTYSLSAIQTFIDSSLYSSTFTATLTNGSASMTAAGVTGTITVNATSTGGGTPDYLVDTSFNNPNLITIITQNSGTTGSDGTYTLNKVWPGANTTATFHSAAQFSIGGVKAMYVAINTFANSYCNGDGTCVAPGSYPLGVRGYEGGYSPDVTSSVVPTAADTMQMFGKFVASTPNSANGIEGYVTTNCVNFTNSGGKYCSLFQLTGIGPSGDDWSALPDIYVPNGSSYMNGYINLP